MAYCLLRWFYKNHACVYLIICPSQNLLHLCGVKIEKIVPFITLFQFIFYPKDKLKSKKWQVNTLPSMTQKTSGTKTPLSGCIYDFTFIKTGNYVPVNRLLLNGKIRCHLADTLVTLWHRKIMLIISVFLWFSLT